jgi:hypothetical protein
VDVVKKKLSFICAIIFILYAPFAQAYSSYGVRGCGKFISVVDSTSESDKYVKNLTEISVKGWIAGYITAHNAWLDAISKKDASDAIATTDIDGVYMSVVNHCRANPLNSTNDAIVDTLNQLDSKSKRKR